MGRTHHFLYDSRDKKPYIHTGHINSKAALKTGDNTLRGYKKFITVERKSFPDFVQCLTGDWDRFFTKDTSQVNRLTDMEFSCIVVEGTMRKCKYQKFSAWPITPDRLMNRLSQVMLWVPICMFDTRAEAKLAAFRFLLNAKKEMDLA